jgi:hypothetical protein
LPAEVPASDEGIGAEIRDRLLKVAHGGVAE